MIDPKKFFDYVRAHVFLGNLTQPQVDGINAILAEWFKRELTDFRWLAYMLATTKWETASRMQPIEEFGLGRYHSYGQTQANGHAYYGRGYVQLTWIDNYRTMGSILGVDLVNHPELALNPTIAAGIMFEGMIHGSFTGQKLADYFNAQMTDYFDARRIINGLDHANDIAGVAKQFFIALSSAVEAPQPTAH